MKLTLKQSSIAMAVCTSLYLALRVAYEILVVANFLRQCQLLPYLPLALLLLGAICMGVTLYFNAHQLPTLTKPLKWQAVCLGVITLCVLVYNLIPINAIFVNGIRYCYWHSSWLRIAMATWSTAWFWQYAFLRDTEKIGSKLVGGAGAVVAFLAALLLTFMAVSFVHVLMTDHVAGFNTSAWMSWFRHVALLAFLGTYLLRGRTTQHSAEQNESQSLQHTHAFSKASQVLAWVSVGGIGLLLCVGIVGGVLNEYDNRYWEDCYLVTAFGFVHMLWISSVITMLLEKQLPKWHRTINILAPLTINGFIVLTLSLETYIPRQFKTFVENTFIVDLSMLVLYLSIIFIIIVWLINTVIVLRTRITPLVDTDQSEIQSAKEKINQ